MTDLFRQQAQANHVNRLYGEISLAQPLSLYLIVAFLTAASLLLVLFLSIFEYARKETVRGYLLPDAGIIRSFPLRSGVITELHVKQGESVTKGQPIATISVQSGLDSGQELGERIIELLEFQKVNLAQEREQRTLLYETEMRRLIEQRSGITESIAIYSRQNKLLEERIEILRTEFQQYEELLSSGFLSEAEYQAHRQRQLIVEQEYEESNRRLADTKMDQAQINAEIDSKPIELEIAISNLENQISNLNQQVDETQNSFRFTVTAPEAGTIASLAAVEGEFIAQNRQIASIIPKGSVLVAELLVPSRSAGFLQLGDEARLRIEAFPYQRFGSVKGTVTRIDRSMILNGEANIPLQLSEPVFRVRTSLESQFVSAYGELFEFRSGMLLEADIILDRRSLIAWILDPILSLRGRVS